jgi:tryptophan synthase alpha chain
VALYLKRLKAFNLKNPFLVGFGIKDKESFDAVNEYANGAIIGSAYIKALKAGDEINTTTKTFLASILK